MAVGAKQGQIRETRLISWLERMQWAGVVTFYEPLPTLAVHLCKVEATDLAKKSAM